MKTLDRIKLLEQESNRLNESINALRLIVERFDLYKIKIINSFTKEMYKALDIKFETDIKQVKKLNASYPDGVPDDVYNKFREDMINEYFNDDKPFQLNFKINYGVGKQVEVFFHPKGDSDAEANYGRNKSDMHGSVINFYNDDAIYDIQYFAMEISKCLTNFGKKLNVNNDLKKIKTKALNDIKKKIDFDMMHETTHMYDDLYYNVIGITSSPGKKKKEYKLAQKKWASAESKYDYYLNNSTDYPESYAQKVDLIMNTIKNDIYLNSNEEYNAHFLTAVYEMMSYLLKHRITDSRFISTFTTFNLFSDRFFKNFLKNQENLLSDVTRKKMIKRLYEIFTTWKAEALKGGEQTNKSTNIKNQIKSIVK